MSYAEERRESLALWARISEPPERGKDELTTHESRTFALVIDGKTQVEIAEFTGLHISTIERHVSAIVRKLGARTLAQACWIAGNDAP